MTKPERREFLMLAKPSKGDEDIGGWYLSEKLDGMRCFWDGGISRGFTIDQVPWANTSKNTETVSTGLWSRYANPIAAPDWFLNELPCCPLDGELFAGRGEFQTTMSTCRKKTPVDHEWRKIQYRVFSSPSLSQFFRTGLVKGTNIELNIFTDQCDYFLDEHSHADYVHISTSTGAGAPFDHELEILEEWLEESPAEIVSLHAQLRLPEDPVEARAVMEERVKRWVELGGEGGMVRCNKTPWTPKRVGYCLKVKPSLDAEAFVIGGTSGKVGKTGKYHGLMGNLLMKFGDVEFELSGFTDEERHINCEKLYEWALQNPGKRFPEAMLTDAALQFNLGEQLTFKYRELSKDGVPKEARYLRKRVNE